MAPKPWWISQNVSLNYKWIKLTIEKLLMAYIPKLEQVESWRPSGGNLSWDNAEDYQNLANGESFTPPPTWIIQGRVLIMSSTGISHHKINAFSLVYPRLVLVSSDIIGQNKCSTPVTMSQERALDFILNFFMEIKETLSQFLISLDIHRLAYCIVSKREISHRQKKSKCGILPMVDCLAVQDNNCRLCPFVWLLYVHLSSFFETRMPYRL